jgi:hypothetical protein
MENVKQVPNVILLARSVTRPASHCLSGLAVGSWTVYRRVRVCVRFLRARSSVAKKLSLGIRKEKTCLQGELIENTVDPVIRSWLRDGYVRSVHTKKWLQQPLRHMLQLAIVRGLRTEQNASNHSDASDLMSIATSCMSNISRIVSTVKVN